VLDLIIRARDINHISSLYVTKKIHEISYLAHFRAERDADGNMIATEARSTMLPRARVIVLDAGRIVFDGPFEEFAKSDLPSIRELVTLERHDHSSDPYFSDPWDKRRHPAEAIL
jgi:hypothetical protein